MDDEEGREQPGSLEPQDAGLEEQKTSGEDIVAPEADDVSSGADLAADGPTEETSVTQAEAIVPSAEVTAVIAPEQTAVTEIVPESATDVVLAHKHNRLRSTLVGVLVVLTCLSLVAATGVPGGCTTASSTPTAT